MIKNIDEKRKKRMIKMTTTLEQNLRIISKVKKELNRYNATLFYLTISGSKLYGFDSKDSDIDYRGCYVINTHKLLGLKGRPREVIELGKEKDDIVLFELQKEINLALDGNCNVLEHLTSKPLYATAEYLTLQPMLLSSYGKNGIYGSYKGMATFNYKKFIASGRKNTVKKYLYVFRGLLAGIYALEMKRIEPNILVLNKHFKIPEVKDLVLIKQKGKEKDPLPKKLDSGRIEEIILKLFEKIDKTYQKSDLREKPEKEDKERIEKWLIQLRKKNL